jgi:hypothetical protein
VPVRLVLGRSSLDATIVARRPRQIFSSCDAVAERAISSSDASVAGVATRVSARTFE